MNFLAHLHLASLANSSLLGNSVADFVRGDPRQIYSAAVAEGIMLHRRIDVMTDAQPSIKQVTQLFLNDRRRVAPIALDIIWDHFLARHWSELVNDRTLAEFAHWSEAQIVPYLADMPESFQNINRYLWHDRWLERYAELDFIADVLTKMAVRRPKLKALADCMIEIERYYDQLEAVFWQFYPVMMEKALKEEI